MNIVWVLPQQDTKGRERGSEGGREGGTKQGDVSVSGA